MRGPRNSRLLGFKSYLNNRAAMYVPYMHEPRVPRLLEFKNFANNRLASCRTTTCEMLNLDLESPAYMGLKII